MIPADEGLAELHTHLGGSVASDILWSLAHEQGLEGILRPERSAA